MYVTVKEGYQWGIKGDHVGYGVLAMVAVI
jgi:hypothetical protein